MEQQPSAIPRYPRIEDPSNIRLIDPIARRLVPVAVRLRISANAISLAGVPVGAAAAIAYWRWQRPGMIVLGFAFTLLWLMFDSLDGMVARATGTSSAFGRELDGICDHVVFTFLYIGLAISIGGKAIWGLMFFAALAHAIQASLYEAERDRFHRRMRGEAPGEAAEIARNPATRAYNAVSSCLDRLSAPFDHWLGRNRYAHPQRRAYAQRVVPIFQAMLPLTQNMRLVVLFLVYLIGRLPLFLWYELIPLSLWTAIGIARLRGAEASFLRASSEPAPFAK